MPTLGTWFQGWVSTLKEGTCNFVFERNWGANVWEVPRRSAARRFLLDPLYWSGPKEGCCGAGTQPRIRPVTRGFWSDPECGTCGLFSVRSPETLLFSLGRRAWLSGLNVSPVRVKRNATFSRILKQPGLLLSA